MNTFLAEYLILAVSMAAYVGFRSRLMERLIPGAESDKEQALIEFPERRFLVDAILTIPFLIVAIVFEFPIVLGVLCAVLVFPALNIWGTHMYRRRVDYKWVMDEPTWRKRLREWW
jgi:hypothetical protein